MKPLVASHSHWDQRIVLACMVLGLVGIFFSKALITITYGLMVIYAAYLWIKGRSGVRYHAGYAWIGVFVIYLLSGINSANLEMWRQQVVLQLPFLLVPLAFATFSFLDEDFIVKVHIALHVILLAIALYLAWDIAGHWVEYKDRISKGQSIPTPIEHVKFSMFCAYAVASGLWLAGRSKFRSQEAIFMTFSTIIIFGLLHVLAVRTGLLIAYVMVLSIGLYPLVRHGKWWRLLGLLLLGAGLLATAIHYIPFLHAKWGYMWYDWQKYIAGEPMLYSDAERLISLEMAWDLWRQSPFCGHGIGDIRSLAIGWFAERGGWSEGYFQYPHNQFAYWLVGTGSIGFIGLLVSLYYPIVRLRKQAPLLLILFATYSLSFMVENSLQRSMSIAFFVLMGMCIVMAEGEN